MLKETGFEEETLWDEFLPFFQVKILEITSKGLKRSIQILEITTFRFYE